MFNKSMLILCLIYPLMAEVFEGYTLFTPSSGGGGANTITYLKANDLSNINTWTHCTRHRNSFHVCSFSRIWSQFNYCI